MAPKENLIIMQKHIRLWEVLTAFAALCTGFGIIIWNIYTIVIKDNIRIDRVERSMEDYRGDVKEINKNIETILIKIENKQNRP